MQGSHNVFPMYLFREFFLVCFVFVLAYVEFDVRCAHGLSCIPEPVAISFNACRCRMARWVPCTQKPPRNSFCVLLRRERMRRKASVFCLKKLNLSAYIDEHRHRAVVDRQAGRQAGRRAGRQRDRHGTCTHARLHSCKHAGRQAGRQARTHTHTHTSPSGYFCP